MSWKTHGAGGGVGSTGCFLVSFCFEVCGAIKMQMFAIHVNDGLVYFK